MKKVIIIVLTLILAAGLFTACPSADNQDVNYISLCENVVVEAEDLLAAGELEAGFAKLAEYPSIDGFDPADIPDMTLVLSNWSRRISAYYHYGHAAAATALTQALEEGATLGVDDESLSQLCLEYISGVEYQGLTVRLEPTEDGGRLLVNDGPASQVTLPAGIYGLTAASRPELLSEATAALAVDVSAVNIVGSSTANIMNGGALTIQGDTLYYCEWLNEDDAPDGLEGIYLASQRLEPPQDNGGEYEPRYREGGPTYLKQCNPVSINVVGDWIYYIHYQGYYDSPDVSGVYKMRLDGSDCQPVREGGYAEMYVTADHIHVSTADADTARQILKLDTAGNLLASFGGLKSNTFALEGVYYYAMAESGGIVRINHETGSVKQLISDATGSSFRLINDTLYYNIWTTANETMLYSADISGENQQSMKLSQHYVTWGMFQGDGRYLIFSSKVLYHDDTNHLYLLDTVTGQEVELDGKIPTLTSAICMLGDYMALVSRDFKGTALERKDELKMAMTVENCSYSITPGEIDQPDRETVIRNAQELYDLLEAAGGAASIRTQAQQIFSYRQELETVYAAYDENELSKEIQRSMIQTMCSLGYSAAGLINAAAQGASAAAITADLAKEAANTTVDLLLEKAAERPDDLMYLIAHLSNPVSLDLLAVLHEELDRDNITYEQAADYIRAYTAAKMDHSTVLLAYIYFEDMLPTGFWEKVTDNLANTALAFEEIIDVDGDLNITYSPDNQEMAVYAKNMLAGTSNEFFAAVSAYEDEGLTRWGMQMDNLQQAMWLMLDEK